MAFADFAIAMMAFFLVLWLSGNSTPEQKQAMSAYFEDPIKFSESGSTFVIDMGGAALTKESGESLAAQIGEWADAACGVGRVIGWVWL